MATLYLHIARWALNRRDAWRKRLPGGDVQSEHDDPRQAKFWGCE